MKKAISAVLAIMMCVLVAFTGCDKSGGGSVSDADKGNQGEDIRINAELGVVSDNKIVEQETTYEPELGEEIELFIKSTYYLEGTVYSAGEAGFPVTMATDGKGNVQMTASVEGLELGFLNLGDEKYIIMPSSKEYTSLDNKLLDALDMGDEFSMDEFPTLDDDEAISRAKESQINVLINGKPGICTTFTYPDTTIKLYSVDKKLVQVDNYDGDGKLSTQIVVSKITGTIPVDQLTLKGLKSVSAVGFIKAITSASIQ